MTTPLALPEEYPSHPSRTLVTVPHAGGGGAVANALRAAAPDDWLVAGVTFGGRESRFLDEPPAALADLVGDTVAAAAEAQRQAGSAPVLIGQCSGALVAWLAAASLAAAGSPPAGLVLVSRSAPSWPGDMPDTAADDDEFLRQVVELGGVPADVAELPELLELLLPAMRADFAAIAQWSGGTAGVTGVTGMAAAPVPLPALALYAPGDPGCPVESVTAWDRHVGPLTVREVSGRHLLLSENPGAVAAEVSGWLPTLAPGRDCHAGNV